jgi:hypothetical protein
VLAKEIVDEIEVLVGHEYAVLVQQLVHLDEVLTAAGLDALSRLKPSSQPMSSTLNSHTSPKLMPSTQ